MCTFAIHSLRPCGPLLSTTRALRYPPRRRLRRPRRSRPRGSRLVRSAATRAPRPTPQLLGPSSRPLPSAPAATPAQGRAETPPQELLALAQTLVARRPREAPSRAPRRGRGGRGSADGRHLPKRSVGTLRTARARRASASACRQRERAVRRRRRAVVGVAALRVARLSRYNAQFLESEDLQMSSSCSCAKLLKDTPQEFSSAD